MFSGLHIATSGMRAAQLNLAITGHNVANSEIPGYSRQRVVRRTYFHGNVELNRAGNAVLIGMGTDWNSVHQIRNEFLDLTYRENMGRLSFYSSQVQTGLMVEGLLGELHGAYNFQSVINDMWFSLQELSLNVSGIDTRTLFLANSRNFLNLAQHVYNGLYEYQMNLNDQIKQVVSDINTIVARIEVLNVDIRSSESTGDRANDFRDERNLLLDRLSELIPLETETARNGDIVINAQGRQLLANGVQNIMGLRYVDANYPFVEPVFTTSSAILPANSLPGTFMPWTHYNRPINNATGNDFGTLNALLAARGTQPAHRMSNDFRSEEEGGLMPDLAWRQAQLANAGTPPEVIYWQIRVNDYPADRFNFEAHRWSINNAFIPEVQMHLDRIVNSIVTLINDALTGNLSDFEFDVNGNIVLDTNGLPVTNPIFDSGPYDQSDPPQPGQPLFIREIDRYEDPPPWPFTQNANDIRSILSIKNMIINPAFDDRDGHNLLALSLYGELGRDDNRLILEMQRLWQTNRSPYAVDIRGREHNIQDSYIRFVGHIATEISESNARVSASTIQVQQADNMRNAIKGVSMDEELNAMLRFQFAFQAASRVFNLIDGMIDVVINRMR
jgi:flagellar hook-associated protein 1 FlgK